MSHTIDNYRKFNIPKFVVWDEETQPCLTLHLDPTILSYHTLEYHLENECGTYAYSTDIEDLKKVREQLIKVGRFKPTELTFGKLPNIKALVALRAKKEKAKNA